MAYCKNCHKYIDDGLKYCDECAGKINSGEFSEDYLDNLLKSVTGDEDGTNSSDNVDDIDVLGKIFDNFSSKSYEEEEEQDTSDGSNLDIESLIEEGNQYSQEILSRNEENAEPVYADLYDEKGMYIAPDEDALKDIDGYIDNASEDELLELLNSMSADTLGNEEDNQENLSSDEEDISKEDTGLQEDKDDSVKQPEVSDLSDKEEQDNNDSPVEDNAKEDITTEDTSEEDTVREDAAGEDTTADKFKEDKSKGDTSFADAGTGDEEFSTEEGTVFMAKKKESLFKKLFGNVYDENESQNEQSNDETEEDQEDEEALKKERKAELKKQKAALKAEKKAKKEDLKRRKQAQKDLAKKEEKESEQDKGHINKIGATIIFILAGAICAGIIITQTKFSYSNKIKTCKKYYEQNQYSYAYLEINGMKLKDDDKELYDKLRTIMYVQQYIDDSDNFYEIKLYDKSLHSLLTSIEKYRFYYDTADELDIKDVYDTLYDTSLSKLKEYYDIDEQKAGELIGMEDKEQYSLEIKQYTKSLYTEE